MGSWFGCFSFKWKHHAPLSLSAFVTDVLGAGDGEEEIEYNQQQKQQEYQDERPDDAPLVLASLGTFNRISRGDLLTMFGGS